MAIVLGACATVCLVLTGEEADQIIQSGQSRFMNLGEFTGGDSDEDDDEARENPVNKLPLQAAAGEAPLQDRTVIMNTLRALLLKAHVDTK